MAGLARIGGFNNVIWEVGGVKSRYSIALNDIKLMRK